MAVSNPISTLLAAKMQLYPRMNTTFFNVNKDGIKLLQKRENYHTFPSLGEDFVRFAIEVGIVDNTGVYPMLVNNMRFKRKDLTQLEDREVAYLVQATEHDLPPHAQILKYVNVISIILNQHRHILEPFDFRFSTAEDNGSKGFFPAHYFITMENYQKFVYGKYEFDADPPSLDDFKQVP